VAATPGGACAGHAGGVTRDRRKSRIGRKRFQRPDRTAQCGLSVYEQRPYGKHAARPARRLFIPKESRASCDLRMPAVTGTERPGNVRGRSWWNARCRRPLKTVQVSGSQVISTDFPS
jgi:hypothetical protein